MADQAVDRGIPLIDIAPFRRGGTRERPAVAEAIGRACEDIGFFTVVGHGVSSVLVSRMHEVSRAFFDLPLGAKASARCADPSRGYRPFGDESLSGSLGNATPPDLKETLDAGPVDVPDDEYHRGPEGAPYFVPNVWPADPLELRAVWTEYYRRMSALAADLMRIFAVALELPEDFFADKIDRHITRLRAINYPEPSTTPRRGQLRSGAHSDYGSLTILSIEDAPGGLQAMSRAGGWVDVQPVPESFVVNLGDLMAYWTNDRWVSTLHRVVNPPVDRVLGSRRQSIVFFHQPNFDAVIECLPTCQGPGWPARYPPITSGDHRRQKFARTVVGFTAPT
jgi:isopenicillin N synthase-like dioxygenase